MTSTEHYTTSGSNEEEATGKLRMEQGSSSQEQLPPILDLQGITYWTVHPEG